MLTSDLPPWTCIFTAIQGAAVVALTGDQTWLEGHNAIYQERRAIILEGLAAVGIKARKPLATLYVWGRYRRATARPNWRISC